MKDRLIKSPPVGLRQRRRADGTWRIWWEPRTALRELGFEPVELDPERLTWSVREAERLNGLVEQSTSPRSAHATPTRGRTVAALISAYVASPRFATRKPATQRDYREGFRQIEAKWGSSLVVDFTRAICFEWYETLYRTRSPFVAIRLLRHMSILMSYAQRRGWRDDNPARDLGMETPPRGTRVATWPELEALLAAARDEGLPSMELAIALAAFQGQRQADIISAERAAISAEIWTFRRSKRGNAGALPIHPEVLPLLEQVLQAAGERRLLLHYEGTALRQCDQPYDRHLFQKVWSRVRARAAKGQPTVASVAFRDLRRTFGHLSRLGGADPRDIGDALGNQAGFDPNLGQIYMPPSFETASRAVRAIVRPKPTDD